MQAEPITYDRLGRMNYNPSFHKRHVPWTLEDLEYLCKFHEVDGIKTIALALERTEKTVGNMIYRLRKTGQYEQYRKLNRFYLPVN